MALIEGEHSITKAIEKGITEFSKISFRFYAHLGGEEIREYLPTIEEARKKKASTEAARNLLLEPGACNTKKRKDAKDQDLPIGLYTITEKKKGPLGMTTYRMIRCSITRNGKTVKTFTASYGINRAREEAASVVCQKRDKWVLENKSLLKRPA